MLEHVCITHKLLNILALTHPHWKTKTTFFNIHSGCFGKKDHIRTVSVPLFCWEGQLSVPNFGKEGGGGGGGLEKKESLGELKEYLPWIFAWGDLICFLSNKDFYK